MNKYRTHLDLPLHVELDENQAEEFREAIRAALLFINPVEVKDLYLFAKDKDAVVISFDGLLHPFLCRSYGFNVPSCRVRVYRTCFVLDTISKALMILGRDTSGGRTFLNSTGVFCVDEDVQFELVTWNWPSGDLVREILKIRDSRTSQ
jgi:hypothetical protein